MEKARLDESMGRRKSPKIHQTKPVHRNFTLQKIHSDQMSEKPQVSRISFSGRYLARTW